MLLISFPIKSDVLISCWVACTRKTDVMACVLRWLQCKMPEKRCVLKKCDKEANLKRLNGLLPLCSEITNKDCGLSQLTQRNSVQNIEHRGRWRATLQVFQANKSMTFADFISHYIPEMGWKEFAISYHYRSSQNIIPKQDSVSKIRTRF